jgi:hypothetical protein
MHPAVIDAADPMAVAAALWNDPFLIATWARLWERSPEPPLTDVLQQYVDTQCKQAAIAAAVLPAEVSGALQRVANVLLQTTCLRPTIVETLEHLAPAAQKAFRALLRNQRIARVDSTGADARLAFAHDRLRDFVLSSTLVRTGAFVAPAEAVLRDPLFAEVFALSARAADPTALAQLVFANPLSGAIAVSESTPLDPDRKREIECLLTKWWNDPATTASGERQAARAFARDWWAMNATPLSAVLDSGN